MNESIHLTYFIFGYYNSKKYSNNSNSNLPVFMVINLMALSL